MGLVEKLRFTGGFEVEKLIFHRGSVDKVRFPGGFSES